MSRKVATSGSRRPLTHLLQGVVSLPLQLLAVRLVLLLGLPLALLRFGLGWAERRAGPVGRGRRGLTQSTTVSIGRSSSSPSDSRSA